MNRANVVLACGLAFASGLGLSGCIDAVVGEVDICTYQGKGYSLNEKIPAADGCNTCTCNVNGEVSCTEIACNVDGGGGTSTECRDGAGKLYKIGDSFPAPDGCNTCSCTAQGAACTLIGCGGNGTCTVAGKTYKAGESYTSPDGCNGCQCQADGSSACTARACNPGACVAGGKIYQAGEQYKSDCNTCTCQADGSSSCTDAACGAGQSCSIGSYTFANGASVICEDGCNSCGCFGGLWASTLIGCPALPKIEKCPNDNTYLQKASILYLTGNTLAVQATFAGCANEGQKFKLCYDGSFRESFPVQSSLFVVTDSTPTCSALPTGSRVFDLSPMADAYKALYQSQSGMINLALEGGDSAVYKF